MIMEVDYPKPVDAAEGYERVHKVIFYQVHKFVREHGGDFDELLGEAHELFLKGHEHFVRGTTATGRVIRHDYATHMRFQVWYGLFDSMRTRRDQNTKAPVVTFDITNHDVAMDSGFDKEDFVAELSADGVYVAELVINQPPVITRDAEAKGGSPCNYRTTVRAYLRLMGWSAARINAAFAEIKTALG